MVSLRSGTEWIHWDMYLCDSLQDNWPAYGVDVLRWWAANKYNMTNVDIGPAIMKQHNEQMLLVSIAQPDLRTDQLVDWFVHSIVYSSIYLFPHPFIYLFYCSCVSGWGFCLVIYTELQRISCCRPLICFHRTVTSSTFCTRTLTGSVWIKCRLCI